jgi:hypothetical protein
MDRKVIDGFLHLVARITYSLGLFFRDFIDVPVINGFGDFMGEGAKRVGNKLRVIQTGKVQQYMLIALVFVFAAIFYFVFTMLP